MLFIALIGLLVSILLQSLVSLTAFGFAIVLLIIPCSVKFGRFYVIWSRLVIKLGPALVILMMFWINLRSWVFVLSMENLISISGILFTRLKP